MACAHNPPLVPPDANFFLDSARATALRVAAEGQGLEQSALTNGTQAVAELQNLNIPFEEASTFMQAVDAFAIFGIEEAAEHAVLVVQTLAGNAAQNAANIGHIGFHVVEFVLVTGHAAGNVTVAVMAAACVQPLPSDPPEPPPIPSPTIPQQLPKTTPCTSDSILGTAEAGANTVYVAFREVLSKFPIGPP